MRLSCPRQEFLQALEVASAVAANRSPKEILKKVKLEVGEQAASLVATDLEVGVRITLSDVDVNASGEAMLPPSQVAQILREANDERLVLETVEESLVLRLTNGEFRLVSEDPEEFPPVGSFESQSYLALPTETYQELVRRTVFATEKEGTRYALGAVCWELEGDKLLMVATDGRRLSRVEAVVEQEGGQVRWPQQALVPPRAMQVVERAARDEQVHVVASGSEILLRSGMVSLQARLQEGQFPNWREVFPDRSSSQKTELIAGPLAAAVRQASALLGKEDRGLLWTFSQGQLQIAAHGVEFGQGSVQLPVAWEGEELRVRLDPRFLLDFLRVLPADASLVAYFTSPDAPVLFETEDGFSYVVMPMAL